MLTEPDLEFCSSSIFFTSIFSTRSNFPLSTLPIEPAWSSFGRSQLTPTSFPLDLESENFFKSTGLTCLTSLSDSDNLFADISERKVNGETALFFERPLELIWPFFPCNVSFSIWRKSWSGNEETLTRTTSSVFSWKTGACFFHRSFENGDFFSSVGVTGADLGPLPSNDLGPGECILSSSRS